MTIQSNVSRVWFVTGASSGIGRELVRQALADGEAVAAIARNTVGISEGGAGDRLLALDVDVRDPSAVEKVVAQAVDRFGRIDVVANNAGYGLFGAVEEADDAQARAIFDTNVFGVLNVLRATLPVLRAQRSGHILQGSSYFGQTAIPGVGLLSATKYAVEGLSDALAEEVAPLGIKVTIIEPSLIATPFLSNLQAANRSLTDYDQTVRAVFQVIGGLPAEAFADVGRAACGIRAAVTSASPPRRLALGAAGANDMRAALTRRLAEMDEWVTVTNAVDG
jgi:NAD(P)-dependent dehydrogenase (short-subunit alcohol dehydrogenase family)